MSGLIEFLRYRALRDDLRAGRPGTLDILFQELAGKLYQYAFSITRCQDDAEEVLQDVFMQLVRDPDRLRGVQDLKAYLYRAVRNQTFNCTRRRSREMVLEPSLFELEAPDLHHAAELQQVLDTLPDDQREVVVLKVWQGLTFREIASLLDISPNTAASRWRYALEHMKKSLSEAVYATV